MPKRMTTGLTRRNAVKGDLSTPRFAGDSPFVSAQGGRFWPVGESAFEIMVSSTLPIGGLRRTLTTAYPTGRKGPPMIHIATVHLAEPYEGEDTHVFASLDGETYLPVNRRPEPEDEDAIADLFEGKGKTIRPMRYARRAMNQQWWGDLATDVTHETVGA